MKGEWQHKSEGGRQTERGDRRGGWETDWQLQLALPPAQLQGEEYQAGRGHINI